LKNASPETRASLGIRDLEHFIQAFGEQDALSPTVDLLYRGFEDVVFNVSWDVVEAQSKQL